MSAPRPAILRSKYAPPAPDSLEAVPSSLEAVPSPPAAQPERVRRKRRPPTRPLTWILLSIAALIVAGGIAVGTRSAPAVSYATAAVTRGDIKRVTTASGMVNPVETVQIGSYVSGRISELYCDYNTKVVKGQLCAKIDPSSYQAAVDQSAAGVDTAKAQLGKDQAQLAYGKLTYQRNLALLNRHVVSQDAADNALNAYKQAEAQVALDQATILQRKAELKSAQVNLGYTNIVSPVDGTVVSRSVAIGQTVTANFQTPTLFLIAEDLAKMQVDANVSEAEIGAIHEGDEATFTVQAFPGRTFTGKVTQVRQAPVSVQNVISYDVVISARNADLALKPGMTTTVHIVTAQRHDVLRVPEAALRFSPPGSAAAAAPKAGSKRGVVWVEQGHGLRPVTVQLGLADEDAVEVIGGALKPGDVVVRGRQDAGQPAQAPAGISGAS